MKIGLGQIDIIWENKEENMVQCALMMEKAKEQDVDFILFPEMTLTGFSMNPGLYGEAFETSPTIAFFQKEAIKNNMAVGFGIILKDEEKSENHCIIISETGELLANYSKIHPFSYGAETKHYSGGDELAFCQVKGISVSPLICYDLRFPEIFQACSAKSNLITVIANWPTPRRGHWISLLQARAIENQCFIMGVNRCGDGGGLNYTGDSMVINPYGDIVAHAKEGSGLTIATLDDTLVNQYRKEFPLKADRKPDLYTKFYRDK